MDELIRLSHDAVNKLFDGGNVVHKSGHHSAGPAARIQLSLFALLLDTRQLTPQQCR